MPRMHENQGTVHVCAVYFVIQHAGPQCWFGLYVVFNNKGDMIISRRLMFDVIDSFNSFTTLSCRIKQHSKHY